MSYKLKEKPDARGKASRSFYHRYLKRSMMRAERRKARRDPETVPMYNKHRGWET